MTVPTTRPRPAPIEALPHDPDAEASVLGAMLLSPSAAADAATGQLGEPGDASAHEGLRGSSPMCDVIWS